jgi:hypothetical protein
MIESDSSYNWVTGITGFTKACATPFPSAGFVQQTIATVAEQSFPAVAPEQSSSPNISRGGVYNVRLNRKPGEEHRPLKVFALGCQGGGEQARVAKLLCERIRQEGPPDLIFLLGDNRYPSGLAGLDAPGLRRCFEDVYLIYPELKEIPFFVILGNHDYNISKFSAFNDDKEKFAYWQVLYTYLDAMANEEQKKKLDSSIFDERQQFFQQAAQPGNGLSLADPRVRGWLMPHFYYRLNVESVVFLCLDSNTLARDYYRYHKQLGPQKADNNQYCWLMEQTHTFAGKTVVIAIHQGTKTAGKRAIPQYYDTALYLTGEQSKFFYDAMKTAKSTSRSVSRHSSRPSHNKIIKFILKQLGLDKAMLMCAHDHHLAYGDVLTFGGGGGTLQSFFSARQVKKRVLCLKEYGFGELLFPQDHLSLQPSSSSDSAPVQDDLTPMVTFHTEEAQYTYKFGHRTPLWEAQDSEEELGMDEHGDYVESVRGACYQFLDIKELSKEDVALACKVLAFLQRDRDNMKDFTSEVYKLWKENEVLADLIAQQLSLLSALDIGRSLTPAQEEQLFSRDSSSTNTASLHPVSPSRREDIEGEDPGVKEEFTAVSPTFSKRSR